jgi:transposase InsO family protein
VLAGATPVLIHNSGGMDGCSDAAYQAVLHNEQEIVDGKGNHKIPGMDSTTPAGANALADYLDQIYSTPGTPLLNGTGEAWYDSERGLYIYRGNGAAPNGSVFSVPPSYFTNKTGVVLGQ